MVTIDRLLKVTTAIVLLIFAGISFHAPMMVFLETSYGVTDGVKAWKELLMAAAALLLLYCVYRKKAFSRLFADRLIQLGSGFLLLHLVVACYAPTPMQQLQAGLLIDARYVFFFLIVYVLVRLKPSVAPLLLKTSAASAAVVIVFGMLQMLILPKDILQTIGYGPETIQPYLTVDQNPDYTRINSTLRGPNPLGLYVATVLAIVISYAMSVKLRTTRQKVFVGVAIVGALLVLWSTYSRSALLAAGIALLIVGGVLLSRKIRPLYLVGSAAVLVISSAVMVALLSHTPFVQQVVFHTDTSEGNDINSDQQHAVSLSQGIQQVMESPFGAGIGSTGSASLYGTQPFIIESQYLFVAHEVGILGLLIFLGLWGLVLYRLWRGRQDPLSLALFAIGIGIVVAGLVQPVWVDDTVAILWWGIVAIVLARAMKKERL